MTERMTQKEIKRFVALGVAEDITYLSFDACNAVFRSQVEGQKGQIIPF